MPRGGSKPGERRGGRAPGVKNKNTQRRADVATKALLSGITPLEFLLNVMREPEPTKGKDEDSALFVARFVGWRDRAIEAAKAAAPYVHPKLSNIEHAGKDGGAIQHSVAVEFIRPARVPV